ncbi:MAG TPA: HEAT repeat domain-containing protein [Steroidobacter sp.]
MTAHDAPLQAVIERLAHQSGLRVVTRDPLNQRVTVELNSLALTAVLHELLRGCSFILVAPGEGGGTLWILSKELKGNDEYVSMGTLGDSPEPALREDRRSVDELSAALADHDSNVRLDAVSELGDRSKDDESAILLARAAARDEHPSVRAEALHAIGRGRADIHSPVFTRALNDRDVSVRKAAIGALEDARDESSLQTLAIALMDRDASVRTTAVDAIGEIGGSDARRLLESALSDESAAVREAATEQLLQRRSSRDH